MKLKLAIVAFAGLVLTSCGGGGPEGVVKEFFAALNSQDYDKAKSLSTDDTDKVIDLMSKAPSGDKKEITKVECKTEGDVADCECWAEGEEETEKVTVKKVDGAWKVHMSKSDMMNDAMNAMGDIDMDGAMDQLNNGLDQLDNISDQVTEGIDELNKAGDEIMDAANDAMDKVNKEIEEVEKAVSH